MQAIKYLTTVDDNGDIAVPHVQLQPGTAVEVIVLVRDGEEEITDLVKASQSSLPFWNNEVDEEVWN